MKKFIQILSAKTAFALLLLFIISKTAFAQQVQIKPDAPVVIETVILKFPDIRTAKVYSGLQTALSGTTGIFVRGHCPDADYLFINIDRRYFPKNDDVFQKISDANFAFEVVGDKDDAKQNGICSENQIPK